MVFGGVNDPSQAQAKRLQARGREPTFENAFLQAVTHGFERASDSPQAARVSDIVAHQNKVQGAHRQRVIKKSAPRPLRMAASSDSTS